MPAPAAAIHQQLLRFLGVGGISFAVDIGVMALLVYVLGFADTSVELIFSRCAAWAVAILLAFFLNARFTFGASIRHSRFFSYLFIQAVGAGINLGAYSGLVLYGTLREQPLLAMVLGSALSTVSNFLLVRKFVYRYHPLLDDPDE